MDRMWAVAGVRWRGCARWQHGGTVGIGVGAVGCVGVVGVGCIEGSI